jgi:hypothetical protein
MPTRTFSILEAGACIVGWTEVERLVVVDRIGGIAPEYLISIETDQLRVSRLPNYNPQKKDGVLSR